MRAKVQRLRRKGFSYRAIALRLGIGKTTVEYHCNRERFMERQTASRTQLKQRLVDMFGGKCLFCGYNRCLASLDFHHKDPTKKEFAISRGRSLEKTLAEAKKCVLACKNCHGEIEAGLIVL